MKNKILILLLIFTIPGQAIAANWVKIESMNGNPVYIEREMLLSTSRYPRPWVLTDFISPQKDVRGNTHNSQKVLYLIDCAKKSYGIKAFALYSGRFGEGAVIGSASLQEYEVEMKDVIPESVMESIFDSSCN